MDCSCSCSAIGFGLLFSCESLGRLRKKLRYSQSYFIQCQQIQYVLHRLRQRNYCYPDPRLRLNLDARHYQKLFRTPLPVGPRLVEPDMCHSFNGASLQSEVVASAKMQRLSLSSSDKWSNDVTVITSQAEALRM